MFSGCTVLPDSKETKLGSSDQEASPSAGKNTRVVLVSCLCMDVRHYSYFRWCGFFCGPFVSFATTDEFSVRVKSITPRTTLTVYFSIFNLLKLNKVWPHYQKHVNQLNFQSSNFESHNSLKLSSMNIWDLRLDCLDCDSFLESISPDILAVCDTNLDGSIDSGNFFVRGYFPLFRKDSITHMHSLTVYVLPVTSMDHHRWGSLNQPICKCACLWRLKCPSYGLAYLFWQNW